MVTGTTIRGEHGRPIGPPAPTRWIRSLLVACLLLSIQSRTGTAGSGGTLVYPFGTPTSTVSSGLTVTLSTQWVETSGYRPVYVRVNSVTPLLADRTLQVTVTPREWNQRSESISYEIQLPQGATEVTRELAVPQHSFWNSLRLDVTEEGKRWEDLSGEQAIPRMVGRYEWTEAYPTVLLVDLEAPDPAAAVTRLGAGVQSGRVTRRLPPFALLQKLAPQEDYLRQVSYSLPPDDGALIDATARSSCFLLTPPDRLPTLPQNYASVDLVFMTPETLAAVLASPAWPGLRQHLLTGGNLILYGAETDAAALQTLATRIGQPLDGADWPLPDPENYLDSISGLVVSDAQVQSFTAEDVENLEEDLNRSRGTPRTPRPAVQPLFRIRDFGLGKVVVFGKSDDLFPEAQWAWMFNELGQNRWRWFMRNGISQARNNIDFWEFLIPGVGAAPVMGFLTIISLFMILIGPVNYFVLHRTGRLYLLLVTVPLGAVIVTFGLYGFALFKDGLGTRSRLRSFSEILPGGEIVSWSRQSYYSGLAPSGGLKFAPSATILPMDDRPTESPPPTRVVRVTEKAQQLASGYLTSRSVCQLVVTDLVRAVEPVRLTAPDPEQRPRITNVALPQISAVLARHGEQIFWAEQVPTDGTEELAPVTLDEARKRVLELFMANQLSLPPGFAAPRRSRRYYYGNQIDGGFSNPQFNTSRLESSIQAIFASLRDGSTGLPGMFVVFTRSAPDHISRGLAGVSEESSFHVLQGAWE